MAKRAIEVRPIAGALGAEISGVDLREIDDGTVGAIRKAWLEHCVVFFHDQPLPPARFLQFARRFGESSSIPSSRGWRASRRSFRSSKLEHERSNFGGVWHSDTSYLEKPPMGTITDRPRVPPKGGDHHVRQRVSGLRNALGGHAAHARRP